MIKLNRLLKDRDGNIIDVWEKTINVDRQDIQAYLDANLRSQYEDEVIFDAESELESSIVKNLLLSRGWNFEMWSTGSRGCHFHTRIVGFDNIPIEEREIYRWIIFDRDKFLSHIKDSCTRYGSMDRYNLALSLLKNYPTFHTDTCLRTEKHLVAMENKPHLKTGNIKLMIYSTDTMDNHVDLNLINIVRKIYKQPHMDNNIKVSAMSNDLDDVKRNVKVSDLFKRWGYFNTNKNRHIAFWRDSSSGASVQINDLRHNAFDYGEYKAYGLVTLVMIKYNISYGEAVDKLRNGKY